MRICSNRIVGGIHTSDNCPVVSYNLLRWMVYFTLGHCDWNSIIESMNGVKNHRNIMPLTYLQIEAWNRENWYFHWSTPVSLHLMKMRWPERKCFVFFGEILGILWNDVDKTRCRVLPRWCHLIQLYDVTLPTAKYLLYWVDWVNFYIIILSYVTIVVQWTPLRPHFLI